MKIGCKLVVLTALLNSSILSFCQSETRESTFLDSIEALRVQKIHSVDTLIKLVQKRWSLSKLDPRYNLYDYFDMLRSNASSAYNFILTVNYSAQLRREGRAAKAWKRTEEQILKRIQLDTFYYAKTLNYYGEQLYLDNYKAQAKRKFLEVVCLLANGLYPEEQAIAHNNLAVVIKSQDDPQAALPHLLHALRSFESYLPPDHNYIAILNENIGETHGSLGNHKVGLMYLKKASELFMKSVGKMHYRMADNQLHIAFSFNNLGKRKEALEKLQRAAAINLHNHDTKRSLITLLSIAEHKLLFADYYSRDEINTSYLNCLSYVNEHDISEGETVVKVYLSYAEFLFGEKKFLQSKAALSKAFKLRYKTKLNVIAGPSDLPNVSELSFPTIMDIKMYELMGRISHAEFKITNDATHLELAKACYHNGDSVVQIKKSNILHGASRQLLKIELDAYFKYKLEFLMTLNQQLKDDATVGAIFETFEISHSWDLIEKYFSIESKSLILNSELLEEIKKLKDELSLTSISHSQELSDSINQQNEILYQQLKENHPKYFNYLFGYHPTNLIIMKEFCQRSSSNWISYFQFGDDSLGIILITENEVSLKSSPIRYSVIVALRDTLVSKIHSRIWSFSKEGHELYNALFAPIFDQINSTNLQISPDDKLHGLPFDILLQRDVSSKDYSAWADYYLIQQYDFSYFSSATFAITTATTTKSIDNAVFLAPRSDNLVYNQLEIQTAYSKIGGSILGSNTDEEGLKIAIDQKGIFHFAGHTYTHHDDVDSIYMVLSEGKDSIFLREILELNSNFNLAVLSSCHSAEGIISAEGLRGITYGFAFSGTPNILSSNWSVSDRESVDIHRYFYQNMKKGINTVHGINEAKREYLRNAFEPAKHPFYWSNWIYNGHPLLLRNQSDYATPLIALAIGFIIVYTVRQRLVTRRNHFKNTRSPRGEL